MRRKIALGLLVVAIILLGYLSFYLTYAAWLVGFVVAKLGGGKKEGKPGRVKSIVIPWRSYEFHLHHWVLAALAVIICVLIDGLPPVHPEIFYGFLGGLIFQGVYCYGDWYCIIRSKRCLAPVVADEQTETLTPESLEKPVI